VLDDQTAQKAAIKLVLTEPEDAGLQIARWESAAKLSHPNLMRLFQVGRCQLDATELAYVVMECADENLAQVLLDRPLSAQETRGALEAILEVLACIHAQGFVHGHLRPANILAVGDALKLSGDGLLRARESRSRLWQPSPFDPPGNGNAGVTPAGDVWSLGMTLVATLTQQPPASNGNGKAQPVLPELPAPFDDIARHCLERDPRRRWTIAQIRARLDQPAAAPKPSQPRRRLSYAWASVVLVLALAAVVAALRLPIGAAEHSPPPPAATVQPESATPPPEAAVPAQPPPEPAEPATTPEATAQSESAPPPPEAAIPAPAPPPPQPAEQPKPVSATLAGGGVVHQVLPEVPGKARRGIRGSVKVEVKVRADSTGSVVDAELASPGPSRYFAGLALQAAREWKFSPPTGGDGAAASEWLLHFRFDRDETNVRTERVAR
jgi:TonB family protein